jgi:polygalacturonase
LRPALVQFYECEDVLIQGITLTNSPFWTIHPVFSKNVEVSGITVINPHDSPNTDGIDPESCENVRIESSHFDVGDDCIVLKSGIDAQGRAFGRPCKNIFIRDCTMKSGHGAIVIGSEMSGGIENVMVSNCIFMGTGRGIRIKTKRGRGGYIRNISVSNILMQDIEDQAIVINMVYYAKQEAERTFSKAEIPEISGLSFSNISVENAKWLIQINGLPESIVKDILVANLIGKTEKGVQFSNTENLHLGLVVNNGKKVAVE